jgi:hypothetical protein
MEVITLFATRQKSVNGRNQVTGGKGGFVMGHKSTLCLNYVKHWRLAPMIPNSLWAVNDGVVKMAYE